VQLLKGGIGHETSMMFLFALIISLFTGDRKRSYMYSALIVLYLITRPSSTVLLALLSTYGGYFLSLHRPLIISKLAKLLIIASGLTAIISVYTFEIINEFSKYEVYLKTQILGGQSHSEFRLAVIGRIVQDESRNFLFGNFFIKGINVERLNDNLEWWSLDLAPIHSDFLIAFNAGGLVGLVFFTLLFYFLVAGRLKVLTTREEYFQKKNYLKAQILCIMVFVIFCNFNPMLTSIENTLAICYAFHLLNACLNTPESHRHMAVASTS
jgi:hypothetical protein